MCVLVVSGCVFGGWGVDFFVVEDVDVVVDVYFDCVDVDGYC